MTPIEIAYFKHFMYDRGLQRSFQYYYSKNRPKNQSHPEQIEQYFLMTTREDVIMKAFVFQLESLATRSEYTYEYWKGIDDKWQDYMRQNDDNKINDGWPLLRKSFAILRQNWDAPEYWKKDNFESTKEVYERMHIELPLPEFQWEHGYSPIKRDDSELIRLSIRNAENGDYLVRIKKAKDGNIIRTVILFRKLESFNPEGTYIVKLHAFYCINNKQLRISGEDFGNIILDVNDPTVTFRGAFDEEKKLLIKELENIGLKWDEDSKQLISCTVEGTTETADDTPDIEFVEFEKKRRVVYSLTKGIISFNARNQSWRITVNRIDTKDIKNKQVRYAMIGKTKSGDVMLMFCNNSNGVPITYNSDDYYNINSRDFCEHFMRLLSIEEKLAYLRIEKVAEKIDSITYKVTKQ